MCSHSLSFGNIAPILTADRLNMNPCVSLSSDPLFLWDLGNLVLESAKLIPQGSQQWVLWFTAQVSQQFLWCGLLDLNDWRALPLWLICVVLLLQVLDNAIETEKMIEKYESLASDLLEWIEQTIIILNNRKFANSLVGVQQQLQAFNTYRTVEKPPKWV